MTTGETSRATLVDCSAPLTSASPSSVTADHGNNYSRPSTAPPSILKESVPIPFNPSLPAYVLDRIHPCIPLPSAWNCEHDQYIASLDVQDYHLPAIVRRLKQRFPELQSECVTPGMVDKRLRILDLRVDWQGWKRAISNMPPTGHVDDFDAGFDESSAASNSSCSPIKANNAKKVLANVANKARHHHRRVSTGGMSGKITITKRGTSVTNMNVDAPYNGNHTPPRYHLGSTSNGMGSTTPLVLHARNSAAGSPSATGLKPGTARSPPSVRLVIPETSAAQPTQVKDFAADSNKKMEKREWLDSSKKGKGRARAATLGREEKHQVMGVPSIMRATSGRPVLR